MYKAESDHRRNRNGMTEKQQLFADYYIESRDGIQSAIRAGYSEKTASVTSSKLLKHGRVLEYIAARLNEQAIAGDAETKKRIASGDEVNAFLSDVMRGNVKDAFGLDAGLSDRISAAKELRRIYDVIDKYKATTGDSDALSDSIDAFINGQIAE